jgi:hypothetical protein
LLENSNIPIKLKKISKEEYYIELSINRNTINDTLDTNITVVIHMQPNFPFNQPRVICKTPVKINKYINLFYLKNKK